MLLGLITNYANSYATDAYYDIIAGKFSNSNKLILIMSMPNALSHQELQFLKTHRYKLLHAFKDEYVFKCYL